MPSVAVVSDTTHYLPEALVSANGIHVVSLYVLWAGRQDREADVSDLDAYYDHLRIAEELPTTSQPPIGDFIAAYEPLLADGGEVVSIHLSGAVSGTVESARQAKAELEQDGRGGERITVVDSRTGAGGLALVLLAAAAAARAGADAEAVRTRAEQAREAMKMWFAVDTLEFLRRGGRIGAARAWVGTTMRIKPILTVEAEITPVERVRTSRRAFERMVDFMRAREADGADAWVVQHVQAAEEAERLREEGVRIFGCEPVLVSPIGPVIGTHCGPGLIGMGAMPRALLQDT